MDNMDTYLVNNNPRNGSNVQKMRPLRNCPVGDVITESTLMAALLCKDSALKNTCQFGKRTKVFSLF